MFHNVMEAGSRYSNLDPPTPTKIRARFFQAYISWSTTFFEGAVVIRTLRFVGKNDIIDTPQSEDTRTGRTFFEFQAKSSKKSGMVYICRRKSSRSPAGELELEVKLEPLGFRVLHCQEMSFADQMSSFLGASLIIDPQGAGLVNLVLMKNGTAVETMQEYRKNPCFGMLA